MMSQGCGKWFHFFQKIFHNSAIVMVQKLKFGYFSNILLDARVFSGYNEVRKDGEAHDD